MTEDKRTYQKQRQPGSDSNANQLFAIFCSRRAVAHGITFIIVFFCLFVGIRNGLLRDIIRRGIAGDGAGRGTAVLPGLIVIIIRANAVRVLMRWVAVMVVVLACGPVVMTAAAIGAARVCRREGEECDTYKKRQKYSFCHFTMPQSLL